MFALEVKPISTEAEELKVTNATLFNPVGLFTGKKNSFIKLIAASCA